MRTVASSDEVDRIWNAGFISIFLSNMLMFLGQQMINTLVAKYANYLGAAPTMVGFVTSSFAYTALLFKVVAAPAIDTFNKKNILTLAILGMAVAYFGYSFSYAIGSLLFFRMLQGASQAFSATCALAIATDFLPEKKLGSGIAIFSLAQAICQSIGPGIGLWLASTLGYNRAFFIGALTMCMAACMAFRVRYQHKRTHGYRISIRTMIAKEAVLPAVFMFLLCASYYNITTFLVIYAESKGVGNIGMFFTVYALTLLLTRPFIGRFGDKHGLVYVFLPALCCFAAAFLLISVASTLWMFLLAAFISAFGYGACQPSVQTLCMKLVPKEKRGAGSSTNYIGQDLGNLVGPVVAGFVVERLGYQAMWRVMLVPVALVFVLVVVFRDRINNA